LNIDLGEVASDSCCNYHQEHHSKKDFPQWVKEMNLLANRFLESFVIVEQLNNYTLNTMYNEERESPEQTTMVLWDGIHTDTLAEGKEFPYTMVVQTRSKDPIGKNQPIIAQAPKRPIKPSSSSQ
jgi:hypothetical protein